MLLVVFPLTINPYTFAQGVEKAVLFPKGLALAVIWIIGLFSLMLSHPEARFRSLLSSFLKLPLTLKTGSLLFIWLIICGFFIKDYPIAITLLGNESRLDGLWVQALWYSLALLVAGFIQLKRVPFQHIFALLATGGIVASIFTLLQAYHMNPFASLTKGLEYPPFGTFGHIDILGAYGSFALITLATFAIKSSKVTWWHIPSFVILPSAIVISSNRAAFLAFGVIWVLVFITSLRHPSQRLKALVFTAIVTFTGSIVYFSLPRGDDVSLQPQFQATVRAVKGQDISLSSRFLYWREATRIIRDHPLVGISPDGFTSAFWEYLPEEDHKFVFKLLPIPTEATNLQLNLSHANTELPTVTYTKPDGTNRTVKFRLDMAHNYFLDMALSSGLIGLVLFLTFVFSGLWLMWKHASGTSLAIIAGTLTYGIFGLVWFPTLFIEPIIWGMFGVGIGTAILDKNLELKKP